jgi:predicted nucleotidyltransferase
MLQNKYYKIMKEFLKDSIELYGGELSKKLDMSKKNISLILIDLENQGILKFKLRGNRKYYSLNFSNPLLSDYLVLFEYFRKIEFLEKNKKLIDFSKYIDADIVAVFGSYAKNIQKKNSDLDILIIGKVDILKFKKVGKDYGYDIQVFNFSISDFRKNIRDNSIIIKEIINNHILLKGGDKFIKEVYG